jgi:hypothetical protein
MTRCSSRCGEEAGRRERGRGRIRLRVATPSPTTSPRATPRQSPLPPAPTLLLVFPRPHPEDADSAEQERQLVGKVELLVGVGLVNRPADGAREARPEIGVTGQVPGVGLVEQGPKVVPCCRQRQHVSILLWRIVTSFLVSELQGGPILSALAPFTWDELDARYRADEQARGG